MAECRNQRHATRDGARCLWKGGKVAGGDDLDFYFTTANRRSKLQRLRGKGQATSPLLSGKDNKTQLSPGSHTIKWVTGNQSKPGSQRVLDKKLRCLFDSSGHHLVTAGFLVKILQS